MEKTVDREKQIELALKQAIEDSEHETALDPIRKKPVPVIGVPLNLPLLNHNSARIQPQLEDHPQAAAVKGDPSSAESQRIIAKLVIEVHRNTKDLRESLKAEGQDQPGMITRDGVLINGNTRCVLLRELLEEGQLPRPATMRVGVLPLNYTYLQQLELELVLQKQLDLKDEYRLINELFMIRRLYEQGLKEEEIARSLRYKTSQSETPAQKVKQRIDILNMMRVMRSLHDPPLRYVDFDNQKGNNYEVWRALLDVYQDLRGESPAELDAHLRRWLTAYFVGVDSVHNLRYAKGPWIETRVLREADKHEIVKKVIDSFEAKLSATTSNTPIPKGLALLGPPREHNIAAPARIRAIFEAAVATLGVGEEGVLKVGDEAVPVGDFLFPLNGVIRRALKDAKNEAGSNDTLESPAKELEKARSALRSCDVALDTSLLDPAYVAHRESALELAKEVMKAANEIVVRLAGDGVEKS